MAKRIPALLIALFLVLSMSMVVFAHEVPDLERENCSISITMHMGDKLVPGGTLRLYRVGAVREDDGNYSFVPTGDFKDCGLSFADVDSPDLAKELGKLAVKEKPLQEEQVGKDAVVTFKDLKTGLYLVVQSKAASGYQKVDPFLVSVPMYDAKTEKYDYSVDAYPKVDVEKDPKPTPPPTTKPKPPKLPQTGQTNWPVPVLLVMGLGMMLTGWILRSGRKTDDYEA